MRRRVFVEWFGEGAEGGKAAVHWEERGGVVAVVMGIEERERDRERKGERERERDIERGRPEGREIRWREEAVSQR